MTKIYRSKSDKIVFGVCGGLADYLGIDSTLIRLIFIVATIYHGSGILIYIILAIIMPEKEMESKKQSENGIEAEINKNKNKEGGRKFFGILLIFGGLYLLIKDFIPLYVSNSQLLGVLLLLIGLAILFKRGR